MKKKATHVKTRARQNRPHEDEGRFVTGGRDADHRHVYGRWSSDADIDREAGGLGSRGSRYRFRDEEGGFEDQGRGVYRGRQHFDHGRDHDYGSLGSGVRSDWYRPRDEEGRFESRSRPPSGVRQDVRGMGAHDDDYGRSRHQAHPFHGHDDEGRFADDSDIGRYRGTRQYLDNDSDHRSRDIGRGLEGDWDDHQEGSAQAARQRGRNGRPGLGNYR